MNDDTIVKKIGLRMTGRVWNNFRWEFAAAMLGCLFSVVSAQFYIPLAIQHGASNVQVGIMTAAGPIGLLFAPVWASLVENKRPLPYVIVPNMAARLLIVLPAFYPDPWMFIVAILGVNMLLGVQAPAYASLMTRVYPAEQRGRLMGYVRVASGMMMIPAVFWIGWWIDRSGGAGPMTVAGVTGFVSIMLFFGMKETIAQPQRAGTRRTTLKEQLRLMTGSRLLSMFFIVTTLAGFGNMLGIPLYQIVQVNALQLTNTEIGYIRVAYYILLLVGYLTVGYVADRYSPRLAMLWAMGFYVTVPLFYAVFGTYPAAIAAGGMLGIADAFWDIGCLSYVFRNAPGKEAVVFGLHLLLVGLRGTIAPMLSTALIDVVPQSGILYIGAACVATGLLLLLAFNSLPGPKRSESA